ncbi:MAG: hypothetical protein ACLFN0_01510 [Thermovirgaceae bacterium]
MKSSLLLLVGILSFLALIPAAGAWADKVSADSPVSGDDFSALEKELEKVLEEGKLSIPQRPGSEEEGEEPAELCEGMYHWITYSAKGSRSEARHGHIEIEGYTLPDVFTGLVYRGVGVGFRTRTYQWGNDGYWPDARVSLPGEEAPPLAAEARERGWTVSGGTPADFPDEWIHVKWKDGSAFVAADRLKDFVAKMDLPLLRRHGNLMEEPLEELPPKENAEG